MKWENDTFLETSGTSGIAERLTTFEGLPKNISIEEYASMEKDQMISMINFLVKREDERAQENLELKDMLGG